MGEKIRVTLPYNIFYIINKDVEDFEINRNKLCNTILSYYIDKKIEIYRVKAQSGETLQFNLNKDNDDIFKEKIENEEIVERANYFRNIYNQYVNMPKYQRERCLFSEKVEKIEEIIEGEKKANIKYKNEFRKIEPYAIAHSGNESRNYLYCYCYKNQSYRNYRLKNIEKIRIVNESQEYRYQSNVLKIVKNFDPYLSYGKRVKVRLTESGKKRMKINYVDRPKVLMKEDDIYTLECSEYKAKQYFSKFFEDVEIIEPLSLREWFIKKLENNLQIYRNRKEAENS